MQFREPPRSLLASAVSLAVRPLCVLDPHLDPLRQPRLTVPELWTSGRDSSRQTITGHRVHREPHASTFVRFTIFSRRGYRAPDSAPRTLLFHAATMLHPGDGRISCTPERERWSARVAAPSAISLRQRRESI